MNENSNVKVFLSQLRKFLPEKTIYLALSSLPEDIFDNEDYMTYPCFESDEEIYDFIRTNGFEDPKNLIDFFTKPYFDKLEEMLKDMFADTESQYKVDFQTETISFDMEYMSIYG
jgi:hypothetical protein